MKLQDARAVITGGAGGIGRAIAGALLREGAQVLLVDRDERALRTAHDELGTPLADVLVADLTIESERSRLAEHARTWSSGVNVLINNAGLNPFGVFEDLSANEVELALAVNLLAPLQLCRELLPHLRRQPCASIVNMGSVFGAIGYPGYALYSATKFGLRGFTEALRRELSGTAVSVHYLAPRATRTRINSSAVERMNAELGVSMDAPERVARAVVRLLVTEQRSAVIGWPERLFVRINALLPGIVDRAIRKQLPVIERYARSAKPRRQGT